MDQEPAYLEHSYASSGLVSELEDSPSLYTDKNNQALTESLEESGRLQSEELEVPETSKSSNKMKDSDKSVGEDEVEDNLVVSREDEENKDLEVPENTARKIIEECITIEDSSDGQEALEVEEAAILHLPPPLRKLDMQEALGEAMLHVPPPIYKLGIQEGLRGETTISHVPPPIYKLGIQEIVDENVIKLPLNDCSSVSTINDCVEEIEGNDCSSVSTINDCVEEIEGESKKEENNQSDPCSNIKEQCTGNVVPHASEEEKNEETKNSVNIFASLQTSPKDKNTELEVQELRIDENTEKEQEMMETDPFPESPCSVEEIVERMDTSSVPKLLHNVSEDMAIDANPLPELPSSESEDIVPERMDTDPVPESTTPINEHVEPQNGQIIEEESLNIATPASPKLLPDMVSGGKLNDGSGVLANPESQDVATSLDKAVVHRDTQKDTMSSEVIETDQNECEIITLADSDEEADVAEVDNETVDKIHVRTTESVAEPENENVFTINNLEMDASIAEALEDVNRNDSDVAKIQTPMIDTLPSSSFFNSLRISNSQKLFPTERGIIRHDSNTSMSTLSCSEIFQNIDSPDIDHRTKDTPRSVVEEKSDAGVPDAEFRDNFVATADKNLLADESEQKQIETPVAKKGLIKIKTVETINQSVTCLGMEQDRTPSIVESNDPVTATDEPTQEEVKTYVSLLRPQNNTISLPKIRTKPPFRVIRREKPATVNTLKTQIPDKSVDALTMDCLFHLLKQFLPTSFTVLKNSSLLTILRLSSNLSNPKILSSIVITLNGTIEVKVGGMVLSPKHQLLKNFKNPACITLIALLQLISKLRGYSRCCGIPSTRFKAYISPKMVQRRLEMCDDQEISRSLGCLEFVYGSGQCNIVCPPCESLMVTLTKLLNRDVRNRLEGDSFIKSLISKEKTKKEEPQLNSEKELEAHTFLNTYCESITWKDKFLEHFIIKYWKDLVDIHTTRGGVGAYSRTNIRILREKYTMYHCNLQRWRAIFSKANFDHMMMTCVTELQLPKNLNSVDEEMSFEELRVGLVRYLKEVCNIKKRLRKKSVYFVKLNEYIHEFYLSSSSKCKRKSYSPEYLEEEAPETTNDKSNDTTKDADEVMPAAEGVSP